MSEREFDIIVWGATGFTGRRVAEYLAASEPSRRGLTWAIGGRSEGKLREACEEIGRDVPTVVADSLDRASLDEMCARARVVASTVGPYSKYGAELVAACVAQRTNYCDITGEAQFVRRMIDAHHDEAVARGVRVVHCCGFDSIPSDLGTLCVQARIIDLTGAPAARIRTEVRRLKGTASGGTIASIANILDEARRDPEVRRIAGSPYALNPPDKRSGPRAHLQVGIGRREGRWTAPFLMASVNMKVVRRSHALLHPEADHLDYDEASAFGGGPKGLARAVGAVALLGGIGVGLGIKPLRDALTGSLLPKPGDGPTREQIEAGGFEFVVMGDANGQAVECRVVGDLDPGYGETAKMLAESAIRLCEPAPAGTLAGGVLTPASAMGMPLVERLRAAGMRFDVS